MQMNNISLSYQWMITDIRTCIGNRHPKQFFFIQMITQKDNQPFPIKTE